MSRDVPYVDQESCANCGKDTIRFKNIYHEKQGEKGDKHMEIHSCNSCNTQGVVEYTPPDNSFTLKGPLFGEPEDIDSLIEEAQNL